MDRAEGALRVAEKALSEARRASETIAQLQAAPKGAVSFLVDSFGNLVVIRQDGATDVVGHVRGEDGAPGATVNEAVVDESGCLVLRLSDSRTINAGPVRGEPGKDAPPIPGPAGRSIISGSVVEGDLHLRFTDGVVENVGCVALPGPQGDRGAPGDAGPAGVGIEAASLAGADLVLALSDGHTINVGRIVGKDGARGLKGERGESIKGEKGDPGKPGPKGDPGKPGRDGAIIEFGDAHQISASDMSSLYVRDLIVGDQVFQILTRN